MALDPTDRAPEDDDEGGDDSLALLCLRCHPALSPPSQLALTLRAVGGLSTREIAAAFLVPEATVAQRMGLHVLYLLSNEGYTASAGPHLQRTDLTAEAVRLVRALHRALPDEAEVAGLLALMPLTDARRDARTDVDGSLAPPAEQLRDRWDTAMVAEGLALVARTWGTGPIGPTRCRPRSPPSTTRRPAPRRPTGRRSSPSTGSLNASRPARWSR